MKEKGQPACPYFKIVRWNHQKFELLSLFINSSVFLNYLSVSTNQLTLSGMETSKSTTVTVIDDDVSMVISFR